MPVMRWEVRRLQAARPPMTSSFFSRISFSEGKAWSLEAGGAGAACVVAAAGTGLTWACRAFTGSEAAARESRKMRMDRDVRMYASGLRNELWAYKKYGGWREECDGGAEFRIEVQTDPQCRWKDSG